MKAPPPSIQPETIVTSHLERRDAIRDRLAEFSSIREARSDDVFWEEMVYCFFTGGCSARMGLRSVARTRHLLKDGSREALAEALTGAHRYPNARARYIVESRDFLQEHCGMRLSEKLEGFECDQKRRDWLVTEKRIKGLGYKEASHFLRNVGFRGYAILDKHVLRCLAELKIIPEAKPPNTRAKYLRVEEKLRQFALGLNIDFDEMDLVLWSMKTGEILK